MSEIATVALSGVVGAITGFLAALMRSALEERLKLDAQLRDLRTPLYKAVWQRMRLVPLWPRNDDLTYADLREFSLFLRDWYFGDGGMYMSRQTRIRFGDLQELLQKLAAEDGNVAETRDDDYGAVQRACSALRTAMTNDLLSRRGRGALFPSLPSLRPRRP